MKRERGFTLVEAIVVMVVTSILAGIMVLFIQRPVQSYVETAARADMADVADIALRRMARELQGAVPNSIRLSVIGNTSLLEFIPSKAGGRYLSASDGAPDTAQFPTLDITTGSTSFYVVTPMPVAPYAIVSGDNIIVYNLGTGFAGADAYANNAANRAPVAAVNANTKIISFNGAAFAGALSSPSNRFIVAGTPVTFACVNNANGTGTLTRFRNYGFSAAQANPAGGDPANEALMANNVLGCTFSVQQQANQNSALVGLAIALARPNPGSGGNNLETVTLAMQIHVNNTP